MLSKIMVALAVSCSLGLQSYASDNLESIERPNLNLSSKQQTWGQWFDQKSTKFLLETSKVIGSITRKTILPIILMAKVTGVDASSNYYSNKQNTINSPLAEQFTNPHSKYETLRFLSEDYQDNYSQPFCQANKPISSFLEISSGSDRKHKSKKHKANLRMKTKGKVECEKVFKELSNPNDCLKILSRLEENSIIITSNKSEKYCAYVCQDNHVACKDYEPCNELIKAVEGINKHITQIEESKESGNDIRIEIKNNRFTSSTDTDFFYAAIRGERPLNILTISLKRDISINDKEQTIFSQEDIITDFQTTISNNCKEDSLLLVVTSEGLFNRYTSYLETSILSKKYEQLQEDSRYAIFDSLNERDKFIEKMKEISNKCPQLLLAINYLEIEEKPLIEAKEEFERFFKDIYPKVRDKNKSHQGEETTFNNISSRLEKLSKQSTTKNIITVSNKTGMFWRGEEQVSYRKINLSGDEIRLIEKLPENTIFMSGTKIDFGDTTIQKQFGEIFSFEICQDHYLQTFKKLGGGIGTKIEFIKGKPTPIKFKYTNIRKNHDGWSLLHIIQSAGIDFDKNNIDLQRKTGGLVIHSDSDINKSFVYVIQQHIKDEEAGVDLYEDINQSESVKKTSFFGFRIFGVKDYLKKIKFEPTCCSKAFCEEPKSNLQDKKPILESNEGGGLTEPLLDNNSKKKSKCCCILF